MAFGKAVATLVVGMAVGTAVGKAGFDSSTHTHEIPRVQPEGRRVASLDWATAVV